MNNFYLLFILPSDLVHYIFKIILREKNANIIINRFHFNNKCYQVIFGIINFVYLDNNYISNSLIDNLNFVLCKNIPKKFNKKFWEHLLNLISKRFGEIHIKTIMYNNNTKNNIVYKNLKIVIKLWFKICQKYSIKLQTSEYVNFKKKDKVNFKIINSKHIIKLLDFNKYLESPRVIINRYNQFYFTENYNFIQSFIQSFYWFTQFNIKKPY
tara:strand:- start:19703 stop:20338 length:636 start_codon:yes stop_codon:yes gene_type:complete